MSGGILFAANAAAAEGLTVTIPTNWIYTAIGTVVATLLAALVKVAWPYIKAHFGAVWRLRRAERALEDSSPGLWLAPSIPLSPPKDYERNLKKSKPIIVVANLKGGVGKTTTVANLIGHFGLKKGRKILAIDMDFQGSLSAMILTQADYDQALEQQKDGGSSKAAQLVAGKDAEWIRNTSNPVDRVPTARCIPSYYTLSIMENRVMVEWLIAKRREDVRYSLASTLLDPAFQDKFDMVLIDAPPRLTTGCVQALCAATHVLIPTVLDGLSVEATAGFVEQLATNQRLWPHLKLLGVFGNMTTLSTGDADGSAIEGSLREFEDESRTFVRDGVNEALKVAVPPLRSEKTVLFPLEDFIPEKAELAKEAGNRIIYRTDGGSDAVRQISRAYDRLGDEIDRRIKATTDG